MRTKSDDLVFQFGSKSSNVLQESTLIDSTSDIKEFAEKISNLFDDGEMLNLWFTTHNDIRFGCFDESEFRPAYLAAAIFYVDKI